MRREAIDRVRSFNRAVTLRVGALNDSYLGRGRPLGQARVLFEIAPDGSDMRALRERLGLDSGYFSRILKSLERQGLVTIETEPGDRRRRRVVPTRKGRGEQAAYDALSDDLARSLLEPLNPAQRERLVAAMAEVETLMNAAAVTIAAEPADCEAARFCLEAYFCELANRFETGFDPTKGSSAPDDAALSPPHGCFLIARLHGEPIGCGGLRTLEPAIGEIKRMWVAPHARGLGVAKRLLGALEERARAMGMRLVRLDTNRVLTQAQAMYRMAGYREIERFNDNPYADFWFEKELGGNDN